MGGPEKREAPREKEAPKKTPEDLLQEARDAYQKKWNQMRDKIEDNKKSKNPALRMLALRYEQRMKRETPDPEKAAPTLDEAAIQKNLEKIAALLEQFEQEPAVRYVNAVTFHREFLKDTIRKFPNEPYFQKLLDTFEKNVKKSGNPATEAQVEAALKVLGAYMLDEKFTQLYNLEYAKNSLREYLGYRVKEATKGVTSSDTVMAIQVRLERGLNKSSGELKRVLDAKAEGVVPDELDFTTRGLYIRVTRDGRVALIGASERAKRENHYLAELPTLPPRGERIDRATEEEKKLADKKYQEGVKVYRQEAYATALKRFQDSYLIVASPNTHMMMVKCYEKLGLTSRALEESQGLIAEAEKAAKTDSRYAQTANDARELIDRLNKVARSEQEPAQKPKRAAKKSPERRA